MSIQHNAHTIDFMFELIHEGRLLVAQRLCQPEYAVWEETLPDLSEAFYYETFEDL